MSGAKEQLSPEAEGRAKQRVEAHEPVAADLPRATLGGAAPVPPPASPGNSRGRANTPPRSLQRALMLQTGRIQGNQAAARLAQRLGRDAPAPSEPPARTIPASGLVVTHPDDPSEREAEAVATNIMRSSSTELSGPASPPASPHASARDTQPVPPQLAARIGALNGGMPLPAEEQDFFEPRLGQDLSEVRLHTNDTAAQISRELDARAFTVGSDIAFAAGAYQPGTSSGRRLLAHELAHVAQQNGSSVAPKRVSRAVSLEEAVAEAEQTVSNADVAKEQPEAVEPQPVELTETTAAAGGAAAGGGGGSTGGGAAAPAASTPELAVPEQGASTGQASATSEQPAAPPEMGAEEAASASPDVGDTSGAPAGPGAVPTPGDAAGMTAVDAPGAASAIGGSSDAVAAGASTAAGQAAEAMVGAQPSPDPEPEAAQGSAAQVGMAPVDDGAVGAAAPPRVGEPQPVPEEVGEATAEPTAPAAEEFGTAAGASDVDAATKTSASASETSAPTNSPEPGASETAAPTSAGDDDEDGRRVAQRRVAQRIVQRAPLTPAAPAEDPAFQAVVGQVRGKAAQTKAHEPPAAKAAQAAAAAQMPEAEKKGRAQDRQAGEVASAATAQAAQATGGQAPGFDKAAFVASVKAKIDELTPKDPSQMEDIEGSGVFTGTKQAVQEKVTSGKAAAQGNVDDKVKEEPRPEAVADKPVTPLPQNNPGAPPPQPDASGAAPKPRTAGEVEAPLHAESQQLDAKMAGAGVTEEQLRKSNEPQFQAAVEAKTGAQTAVATDPVAYRAVEQGSISGARAGATDQAKAGLSEMHGSRTQVFGQMNAVQAGAKSNDETKRAEIGRQVDQIFIQTKGEVEGILTALDGKVDQEFNAGTEAAKNKAVDYIKRETAAYKDRRYQRDAEWYDVGSHVEGALTHVGDALTDMPPEYYEYYRQGRDLYAQEMEAVIGHVADIIADHLQRAKQRIEQGKQQIADFVANQPAALREVAQQCAEQASGRFDELERNVDSKTDELVNSLAQRYVEKRGELDAELDKMKEADKGLLAKAGDLIGEAINTIRQLGDMLSNMLARAAGAVTKILQDPIGFLGNLIAGIAQGLQQFVGNIGKHLQTGLIDWLTGAVASAGVSLPAQFDLPGIFSLVMQLLGLTWNSIRAKIVQALGPMGEQIVGALEQAWEVFQIIRTEGLPGLWRFVQGMIGDLKAMVMGQIESMISEQVIKAGIDWLIGILGGPAGAFVKAAQGIIRVVSWFMANGSRVAALVNSVLDSVTAIAAGNISGAATFIEQSLGRAIPTVISFLADLLGLGGVSRKVQGIIQSIQAPINKAIEWIVQKAKALGKKVMGLFKGGKKPGEQDGAAPVAGTAPGRMGDGEVGERMPFTAGGAPHHLWIEVQGKTPVVMVGSTPSPVESLLSSDPVKRFAAASDENKELVASALSLASTSKIDAQKALDLMESGQEPEKVEAADESVEGKERRLLSFLKQIFDGLDGDDQLNSRAKLLKDRCAGLVVRTDRAKKAIDAIPDQKKKERLQASAPAELDRLKSDFTGGMELLDAAKDEETIKTVQETVKESEGQLAGWEREIGTNDTGEDDEGSSLKKFKELIAQGALTYSNHGNKHFRGPVENRQQSAIRSGEGQYAFNHPRAVEMEQSVIDAAAGGSGMLNDTGSMFWIRASRPGVGFVGGSGDPNTVVIVEVLGSGTVHSHPE